LNTKQNILSRSSNVSINSLIVSNDTFSSGSIVPGQISCISLLIDGVNIDTSLNEKQNTLDPTSILSVNKVSTSGDITAGGNLSFFDNTIGSRNVKTEFSATNSAINLKQDKINFLTNLTCATLDCSNLNISGESIDTKIANSSEGITQAQLDKKQNILTSSTNILTARIDVSDKLVITGQQPTLNLKDTNARSGMIHMNDNRMYFLSGETNTESWSQVNGQWPLY